MSGPAFEVMEHVFQIRYVHPYLTGERTLGIYSSLELAKGAASKDAGAHGNCEPDWRAVSHDKWEAEDTGDENGGVVEYEITRFDLDGEPR